MSAREDPLAPAAVGAVSLGDDVAELRLVGVLRDLQELTLRCRGNVDEEIAGVLELGCRELGLSTGFLVRMCDGGATVIGATGPGVDVSSEVLPAAGSYWEVAGSADAPIFFPDPCCISGQPSWPPDPAARFDRYVGARVCADGRLYGVLSFASPAACTTILGGADREIVAVLARHLEGLLARQEEVVWVVEALNEVSIATGAAFFEKLARKTSEILEAPCVLVCERLPDDPGRVRSHANWQDGEIVGNVEYAVAGTPCERVLETGFHHCPDAVQARFPADRALAEIGARSYLGVAIRDGNGEIIGQIATLDRQPRVASSRREVLIRLLGARATAGFARARAERALEEERARLDLLSSAGHIGIFDMDLEAKHLALNGTLREWTGLGEDDCLRAWQHALSATDREKIRAAVRRHIERGTDAYLVEHQMRTETRGVRWFLARGRAVRNDAGEAVRIVGAVFDITAEKRAQAERARLETKVQQAQRPESLGVLAGGLAHDFNNLLMGVLGNAGLARRAVSSGSLLDRKLAEIETAAQRAADLTNQMLAYAGRARFTAESFDLNGLVEEMVRLLRTVVSKKAVLSLQLGSEPLSIEADAAQVRQVVMNLITNASDALADQPGAVSIATGYRYFDRYFLAGVVPDADLTEGVYAFLEVVDSGVGMDDDTRGRIFDPFFTTKFTGRGLGLAAVLGIMRSHGGGIRVQSAPGEGTRATVLFPPADADEAMLEEGPEVDDDAWEGQGAVLVVDDDEMVRSLMATVLEEAGFEVLTAVDGVEALSVFEANADRIRLILLDMMMPRMDGEKVYAEIRARRPGAAIILMSGFSEEQVTRGISDADAKFLKKPFQITDLLDTVQDVLDS